MPRDQMVTKHIGWTTVPTATSYVVVVDDAPLEAQPTAPPFDILVLENTTVQVQVAGVNNGGPGPLSAKVPAVAGNVVPPPVDNIDTGSIDRGTFTVTWDYDDPPTDFSTFTGTTTAGSIAINQTTKVATITGAPDSVNVTVGITARDAGGLNSTARTIIVPTPDAPAAGAPGIVGSLRPTRVGYSSADIAWSAPVGAVKYEYSGNHFSSFGTTTALTYKYAGLVENRVYSFDVRAVNSAGVRGPAATITFRTLTKIKTTTPVYANKLYGYQQANPYSGVGFTHYASGVSGSTDNWAGQANTSNYLYALDNDTQSGPFMLQSYRWITLATSLNYDALNAVYGMFGYQGEFQWDAWDTSGVLVQTGRMDFPGGALTLRGVGPNILNKLTGRRIARIRWYFYPWGSSPGYFKLSELAINAHVITGYTYTYNPP